MNTEITPEDNIQELEIRPEILEYAMLMELCMREQDDTKEEDWKDEQDITLFGENIEKSLNYVKYNMTEKQVIPQTELIYLGVDAMKLYIHSKDCEENIEKETIN